MQGADVIVVGGGPAGAAAARRLRAGGADVLVLDREEFPRLKLCAGWITPQVVQDLKPDIDDYPHGLLDFRRLHWHIKGLRVPVPCLQHSIRRVEFDAWLLRRAGVPVRKHAVREIVRAGADYVIDASFRCRYVIGAGGTGCPVQRRLFAPIAPRRGELQTVALELEFPCEWRDPDCHLWFFERGLPGYSWYVPKAGGWLNVGVGAMAERLKERGATIRQHWQHLSATLERRMGVRVPGEPSGYSYYVRPAADTVRIDNAFLTGDAAGLATRDLCEGIGPAIQSGHLAAQAILTGGEYSLAGVSAASLGGGLVSRWMAWGFNHGGPVRQSWPRPLQP